MDVGLEEHIRLAAEVLKKYGATEVYLFGSAASGKLREHSDVDFAVTNLPAEHFYLAIGEAYGVLGMPLDVVVLTDDTRLARRLRSMRDEGTLKRVA